MTTSVLSHFAVLALLGTAVLPAATIVDYTVEGLGGTFPHSADNIVLGGVTGTIGLYDQNGNIITNGSTVNGPISFRLTDTFITCIDTCNGNMNFMVTINFAGLSPTSATGVLGLTGSGVGTGTLGARADFGSSANRVEFGNVVANGNFSQLASLPGTFTIDNNSLILALRIETLNMTAGDTISLPDSLYAQVTFASGDNSGPITTPLSANPEPGTLALVATGIAGAFWFRRRSA